MTDKRCAFRAVIMSICLIGALQVVSADERQVQSRIDVGGTTHVPALAIPFSDLASPEARRSLVESYSLAQHVRAADASTPYKPGETSVQHTRRVFDRVVAIPRLALLREKFPVKIQSQMFGDVRTDVVTPAQGISNENRNRVLINLHGGGMTSLAVYGGQIESVPIASTGRIKVIAIDYRLAPESRFPNASKDVEAVYRQLLKSFKPENIGIFGCSAGSVLTAQSVAWFAAHGLPSPGAIGLFSDGAVDAWKAGDSNYYSAALQGWPAPLNLKDETFDLSYYTKSDDLIGNPLISPAYHDAVLARFPPTLLMSGSRDIALSKTIFTHERLIEVGVDAELHVWEGMTHCAFEGPYTDPRVPENRRAWKVIVKFFAKHLGQTRQK